MKLKTVKLKDIIPNPDNPRHITEDKKRELLQSIEGFRRMLEIRPIVVDENMVILGGNMRYLALQEIGDSEVTVQIEEGLTEEEKKEFIVKDNLSYGEWDYELLSDFVHPEILHEWGVEIINPDFNMDDFFHNSENISVSDTQKIVLEYNVDDYEKVKQALDKLQGTKEDIIYGLLVK